MAKKIDREDMASVMLQFLRSLLQLALWASMVGCFPEAQNQGSSEAAEESEDLDEAVAWETGSARLEKQDAVRVSAKATHLTHGWEVFSLFSGLEAVSYQVQNCRSGLSYTRDSPSTQTDLQLYKFDWDCTIGIQSLTIAGRVYALRPGHTFDPAQGALNIFVSDIGHSVFVEVEEQLPEILGAGPYSASFLISESEGGPDLSIPVFEVGLAFSPATVGEDVATSPVLTVRRGLPAVGPLTVYLRYDGTAAPTADYVALPHSISFAAGESTRDLPITLVNDEVFETVETLVAHIEPGVNYIPREASASLSIQDDDLAILRTQASLYSFGTRAQGFVHTLRVRLSNTGKKAASAIGVLGNLPPHFSFPGGFPGDGSTCSTVLAAQQSCDLVIAFVPQALGVQSGSFVLSYFNGIETTQTSFEVRGTGELAAHLVLHESELFEFEPIRSGSSRKHLIVRNLGQAPATGLSGSFTSPSNFRFSGGSFPGTGGSCGASLAAGARCSVVVELSAPSAGYFTSDLRLSYSNGFISVTVSMSFEGSASSLLAPNRTISSELNTRIPITLSATSGGTGQIRFELLSGPTFGTLTGTVPNLNYRPPNGFQGTDSFTYRVLDSRGPSLPGEIRIIVRPRVLFIVATPGLLMNSLELTLLNRLLVRGMEVTVVDDNLSQPSDAFGQNLILISGTTQVAQIQSKFRGTRVPIITWERSVYEDLGMIANMQSQSGDFFGNSLRVTSSGNPILSGYPPGNLQVFSGNVTMPWVELTHPNLQSLGTVPNDSRRSVFFAYDEDNHMPGGLLAPAKRIGIYLPVQFTVAPSSSLSPFGLTLFDRAVNWAFTNRNQLFLDTFQRDNNSTLGPRWLEFESLGSELSIEGGQLMNQSGAAWVSAKARFPLVSSGLVSFRFHLNLKSNGSQAPDYVQSIQLGRCDLMERGAPETSGAAVNLLWGGIASGLGGEERLGYRIGNNVTPIGTIDQASTPVVVTVDVTSQTYTVQIPGSTTTPLPFDSPVSLDCVRISSRNINSQGFTRRSLQRIHIFEGR